MATREQLEAAQLAEQEWRQANVTGARLNDQQQVEGRALRDEVARLKQELAKAEFDAIAVPSVVLSVDEESITCRLPREVLNELLICHEAGLSDEEHMAMAMDWPGRMRLLKQIIELGSRLRG